jgi:hypothetical protein
MFENLVMFPNPLPCINTNGGTTLYGLFHHPMAKMTNTKNGIAKMHAKLLCIVATYEICVFFEGAQKEVFSSILKFENLNT